MKFIFCLHYHQPEGTPARELDDAYARAYWPVLQTIAQHPGVRVVLHHSGCLMENCIARKPEYLTLLEELVQRGQVEILGSAIYEPILPAIPERDRVEQIRAYSDLLEDTFGVRPRGAWLAERVWEPSLPRSLARAGIEYVPLDDGHFFGVGVSDRRLYDSFLTEEEAMPLRVFPVPSALRRMIPFAEPEEVIAALVKRQGAGARAAVFADDGEKLGAWPGTYESVQGKRWLSRFFSILEQERDRIQTATFAEYVDAFGAASAVYLPASAHSDMLEWSLPPVARRRHQELRSRLHREGEGNERFLGAGFWRNFLIRYPEANWMHKRGLDLSRRLLRMQESGGDPDQVWAARRHIWKSQCHTAYWHGVSGGVYLPHLRGAVYGNQLAAWRILDRLEHGDGPFLRFEQRDIDLDGEEEVCLENRELALIIDPSDGGSVVSLDLKSSGVNLLDAVARREESYHRSLRDGRRGAGPRRGADRDRGKEGNEILPYDYDAYPLQSLREHVLRGDAGLRTVREQRSLLAPPARLPMEWRREEGEALCLSGQFRSNGSTLRVERRISLDPKVGEFSVTRSLRFLDAPPADRLAFATEWTIGARPTRVQSRYLAHVFVGRSVFATEEDVSELGTFDVVDEDSGFRVVFVVEPACRMLRYPIETVTPSEYGPVRTLQGTRIFLISSPAAGATGFEGVIRVRVEPLARGSGDGPSARRA
jgi:alpha-amylase